MIMDKFRRFDKKLAAMEKVIGGQMVSINSPILLEKMAECDQDFILLDCEHGIFDAQNIVSCLQAGRLIGQPIIVRVQDSYYHLVTKLIDMGAYGIMLPRTETLEQVQKAIDGLYFPPIGKKGAGGYAQMSAGEDYATYKRVFFPQIESPKGIELMPAMLERFGQYIDAFIIGPYDLSITMGLPRQFDHPDFLAAVQKVFDTAKAHGKSVGIYVNDEKVAEKYYKMGANVLWFGADVDYFMRGLTEMADGIRKL